MIVDDDHVVGKICCLFQCTVYSVGNGAFPIAYGDDDARFYRVFTVVMRRFVSFVRSQPRSDGLQMHGAGLFHLCLHFAMCRIDIVELSDATSPQINRLFRIQHFTKMEYFSPTTYVES